MMTPTQIEKKVLDILEDQLGVDESELTKEASLAHDLGADSLDLIEIIMGLEETFNIEISEQEFETYSNVGQIVQAVITKLSPAIPPAA